jgi:hypothetical protein
MLGHGAITALSGTAAAQFAITDKQCGATLAGEDACAVTVVFKPTAAGAVAASLRGAPIATRTPRDLWRP